MKKRLFALLLAAATLVSLAVAPVSAADMTPEGNVSAATDTCPCGCGSALSQVSWKPYTGNVTTGHYYLEDDYVQDGEKNLIAGEKVVLDLRGNTVTTSGKTRLFLVNGYLAVIDTVGGGRLSARCNSSAPGGVVLVQENEIPNGAIFELYSGTITPDANAGQAYYGGLVCVNKGAVFRMYGGLLLNGNSCSYGGSVCGWDTTSTLEILGGSIIGGRSVASAWSGGGNIYARGPLTLKNCSIIGGYTNGGGGNIMKTGNTAVIENCLIADGIADGSSTSSKGLGGNMYIQTSVTLTVKDTEIRNGYALVYGGNVYFGAGTQSKTFTNTRIYGGTTDGMGANLYNSAGAKTTLVDTTIDGGVYYKTGTLTLSGTSSVGMVEGDCPCCAARTWYDYGSADGNHWKLTADHAAFAGLTVAGGQTVVLDLAGFDLTAAGRAFTVEAGGTLILMDSVGGGIVTGSGVAGESGGVISNAGTVKIYGGKYVYSKNADITVSSGGVIATGGMLNIYGGIFDGSAYSNTATTSFGGAVYQTDATAAAMHYFTMSGGRLIGGSAYSGGSLYIGNYGDVTITGGMITGGTAYKDGGNIFGYGGPYNSNYKFRITDCAILDGRVSNSNAIDGWGGNINIARYELTLDNCYIRGGTIVKGSKNGYGGNIHAGSVGVVRATNTVIDSGYSCTAGGNIYMSNGMSDVILTNCLVTNGTCVTSGGNIRANNGVLKVVGGVIAYGNAGTTGGNIHSNTATGTGTTLVADSVGNAPRLYGGTAATSGGNLYISGPATLGAAFVNNGTAPTGGDLYVADTANTAVSLGTDFRGSIGLGVAASLFASAEIYGGAINKITTQATDATVYLDGSFNNCGTLVENNTLYLTVAAVVDAAGNMRWYMSNEAAHAACGAGEYLKLCTTKDLVLTKDCVVDLNGNAVNVSGAYTLYGMDSSGDSYTEPTGKAILAEETTAAASTDAPNGSRYIAVTGEDGTVSCHRLGMQITGVSIRPSNAGIYYTAKWSCDDTLKGQLTAYGMAVSTCEMPTENFATENTSLWTSLDVTDFTSGATKNSAIIAGIMDDSADATAETNSERGKMPVYAKAYVVINGSTYISSEDMALSLYDVMKGLDTLISTNPTKYRRHTLTARDFYNQWKELGMNSWQFSKIPTPEPDDTINVLMIGNSHCYYYVEELYALAKAAGIDMRVCNVYSSGCYLEQHYNWWTNEEANYQFFETYTDGRTGTSNTSLEWCLAQYEWDVISIQEYGVHKSTDAATHFESVKTYREALLPYLKAQFPEAKLLWHQTWGYQPGYDRSDKNLVGSLYEQQREFALLMCEEYGCQRVPSGDAWNIVRTEYSYDHLCERLGINNNWGDYYHEGDIGGGQYLNACVWFEVITGKSVVGNPYIPSYKSSVISSDITANLNVTHDGTYYTLNADFVAMLQNAAHQAVAEMSEAQ